MKSPLKATLILGGSSLISACISMVSAKAWAILIGPAGVGIITGLQSVLALGVMTASFGIGTAVVRVGAKAISDGDEKELAVNWKAGLVLVICFGTIGAITLLIFREWISGLLFGNELGGFYILVVSGALFANVLANFFISFLNAHHRVVMLAKISILNNFVNACSLIGFIYLFRVDGIAYGILCGLAFSCVLSFLILRSQIPPFSSKASFDDSKKAALSLIRFGAPYTASMIVGTGVQIALPLLILNRVGVDGAGFYRAAAGISSVSLSLVLAAMGQDYYPRLSAISNNKAQLNEAVNQQQWLSIIILAPIFLCLLLAAPILIPLLYTNEFQESQTVFKWIVAGDLFKSLAWVAAFVILARDKSHGYFVMEAIGGATALVTALLAINRFGLEGAGLGYFASYVVYFAVVMYFVKKEIGLKYETKNKLMMTFTIITVILSNVLAGFGNRYWYFGLIGIATVACASISAYVLVKQIGFQTLVSKAKFWKTQS